MKTIKTFEEFVNENLNEKLSKTDENDLRDFLVNIIGVKPFHIENYVFINSRGKSRKDELLSMFKNAGNTEKMESFKRYILDVIVPSSTTLSKYLP